MAHSADSIADDPATSRAAQRAAAHATYLQARHFASLDGMRCFCCLAVIWHHTSATGAVSRVFRLGFLGVDFFFVLSGFLIVTLLLRERERRGRVSLARFYARRGLRIFPIYYLVIGLVTAAYLARGRVSTGSDVFFGVLPFLVTYTSNWVERAAGNFSIAWSLAAEEQFYIVWPALERFLARPVVWVVLALALALNQAINFGLFDGLLGKVYKVPRGPEILQSTFTPILLGVGLAHLLHGRNGFTFFHALLGHRLAPWVVILGALAFAELSPGDISGAPRLGMQLSMALVLASLVVREDHLARPVLSWRPFAFLGTISYGMYWYHMWALHPVRLVFQKAGVPFESPLYFLAGATATALVAFASYRLVEAPLLRVKDRFRL